MRLPRAPGRAPWPVTVLLGLLLVAAGGYLALRPLASLVLLLVSVVGGLLVSAVSELVGRGPVPWRSVRAAAYVLGAAGILALADLGLATGLALVVAGVADLGEAHRLRGAARWSGVLGGATSIAFGLLAVTWKDVSIVVVGVLVGIRLLMAGLRLLAEAVGRPRREASPRRQLVGSVAGAVLAGVLVVVSLNLQAGAPRPDDFYAAPTGIPDEPGILIRSERYTTAVPGNAEAWRILYTTTRDEGRPAVASGLVVVPRERADGIPVIAWAHGTTGVAPGCAPTVLDPFEAGAFHLIDDLLAEGWAFVATDYVGLGTEGPHPYLVGQPAGRSVLDAVRAARQLGAAGLGGQTVVWGHSQGGHAALWTGGLAEGYAPDVELAGVAALAPAANLPALIDSVEVLTGGELFASYVIAAYADEYDDVRIEDYVKPGTRRIVRAMAGRCLAEPSTLVSVATVLALHRTVWLGDPGSGPLASRLEENVPTLPVTAPLLLAQGAADDLVTAAGQEAYVAGLCERGGAVDFRLYDGKGHLDLVDPASPAVEDLLAWTRDRLDGRPAGDTCDPEG